MTYQIDFFAIAPELIVAITLLVALGLDLVLPERRKFFVAIVGISGLALAAIPLIFLMSLGDTVSMFDGSYVVDQFALVLKGLFLVAGYLVLIMSVSYVESDRYYQGEYYFLTLTSILGSMVMTSARDLIVLFVALEVTTGPLFMLAGWRKGDAKSNEAAIKFFILGIVSTALLLWGMSMVYGLTGSVRFADIAMAGAVLPSVQQPAMAAALLLMVVGFAFKVSAVPFHFWAPDTYEGAPIPVAAYLSVSSKAAGFVAMFLVLYLAVPTFSDVWGPALWVLAALSMTVANLAALRQSHLVRLLAYSSISQAGFMLVPFAAAAVAAESGTLPRAETLANGLEATLVYLLIYALMNLGAFAVVLVGVRRTGTAIIDGWAGLGRLDPRLGVLAVVFFFSLAGIPPLAGWFAKFRMFMSAIDDAGGTWAYALAVVAAVNAVIAFFYYARVVKTMWFDEPRETAGDSTTGPAGSLVWVLTVAALAVVVVGVYPEPIGALAEAARSLVSG